MSPGLPGLTRRENEVARLLVQGWINKQIGDNLDISERTVKGHRSAIYHKLKIKSVAELGRFIDVTYAIRWRSDKTGACVWVSEQLLEFRGITDPHGDGWLKGLHPDEREAARIAWNRAVKTRTDFVQLRRDIQADGSYHWVFDLGIPVFDAAGGYLGHHGVVIPIGDELARWMKS